MSKKSNRFLARRQERIDGKAALYGSGWHTPHHVRNRPEVVRAAAEEDAKDTNAIERKYNPKSITDKKASKVKLSIDMAAGDSLTVMQQLYPQDSIALGVEDMGMAVDQVVPSFETVDFAQMEARMMAHMGDVPPVSVGDSNAQEYIARMTMDAESVERAMSRVGISARDAENAIRVMGMYLSRELQDRPGVVDPSTLDPHDPDVDVISESRVRGIGHNLFVTDYRTRRGYTFTRQNNGYEFSTGEWIRLSSVGARSAAQRQETREAVQNLMDGTETPSGAVTGRYVYVPGGEAMGHQRQIVMRIQRERSEQPVNDVAAAALHYSAERLMESLRERRDDAGRIHAAVSRAADEARMLRGGQPLPKKMQSPSSMLFVRFGK